MTPLLERIDSNRIGNPYLASFVNRLSHRSTDCSYTDYGDFYNKYYDSRGGIEKTGHKDHYPYPGDGHSDQYIDQRDLEWKKKQEEWKKRPLD